MYVIIWWSSPSQRVPPYFTPSTRVGHKPSFQKRLSCQLSAHSLSRQAQSSRCISLEIQERLSYLLYAHRLSRQGHRLRCISPFLLPYTHAPALNSSQLPTHFFTTHQHIRAPSVGCISVPGGDTPDGPCIHHMMVPRAYPGCCTDIKHLSGALRDRGNTPWCARNTLESARYRYQAPVCCTQA